MITTLMEVKKATAVSLRLAELEGTEMNCLTETPNQLVTASILLLIVPLAVYLFRRPLRSVQKPTMATVERAPIILPRCVRLERDYRNCQLPKGMTQEQWFEKTCIPELLALGTGQHEVDITMPRWFKTVTSAGSAAFERHNIDMKGWQVVYDQLTGAFLLRFHQTCVTSS